MQLYDVSIRLSGNPKHEIRKAGVTAAEVAVYRYLHTEAGVLNIEATKNITRSKADERERLEQLFDLKILNAALGNEFNNLPISIKGIKASKPDKDTADTVGDVVDEELEGGLEEE